MAEELKALIEKIQEEGVRAAEDKAKAIEEEAKSRAKAILRDAEEKKLKLIEEAKEKIARLEKSSKNTLEQAGRDLLLNLRKEINKTLKRLALAQVKKSLTSDELAKIISQLIKNYAGDKKKDITVILSKDDLGKLKKSFLSQLKDETEEGITIKASDEIRGGFIISYDKGKSFYDFTDKALAEHIAQYLKPQLAEILKP